MTMAITRLIRTKCAREICPLVCVSVQICGGEEGMSLVGLTTRCPYLVPPPVVYVGFRLVLTSTACQTVRRRWIGLASVRGVMFRRKEVCVSVHVAFTLCVMPSPPKPAAL
jgi:hypothetical protein